MRTIKHIFCATRFLPYSGEGREHACRLVLFVSFCVLHCLAGSTSMRVMFVAFKDTALAMFSAAFLGGRSHLNTVCRPCECDHQ